MKKIDWLHWSLAAIVCVLSFYLWLTPYRYEKYAGILVRINRFTGNADILRLEGWQPMQPTKQARGRLEETRPEFLPK